MGCIVLQKDWVEEGKRGCREGELLNVRSKMGRLEAEWGFKRVLYRCRGVLPGGAGGATAPPTFGQPHFFRGFHTPLTIRSGVNGFFYVSHIW